MCGRIWAMAAVAAAAAACSTTIQGSAAPDAPKVTEVKVEGNRRVSDGDIVGGLVVSPPSGWLRRVYRRLDRLSLVQDAARVVAYYQRRGHFQAEVLSTEVVPTEDGVAVTFKVREGEPVRISAFDIEGVAPPLDAEIELDDLAGRLAIGEVFEYDPYESLKETLLARLRALGYARAAVEGEVRVDRDQHTAAISLRVDPGPRARFGRTSVRGLTHLPTSAVRNRLAYDEGDRFSPRSLERTRGRLYKLGAFGAVRVEEDKDGRGEVVDVEVSLTEAGRQELRLGGGVRVEGGFSSDAQLEVRGRADYVRRRFLHPLMSFRATARPAWQVLVGPRRQGPGGEVMATLSREDLIAPLVRGSVSVGYQVDEYDAYAERGAVGHLDLSRPLWDDRLLVAASYRFQTRRFYRLAPGLEGDAGAALEGIEGYRVGALGTSVSLDLRDHPLSPTRGFYVAVGGDHADAWLGSQFGFTKGRLDLRGYLPLGERVVLAARGLYERALGRSLPLGERLFGGGASQHRGFAYRRLSPSVEDDDGDRAPVGGEENALLSGEARVSLFDIRGYPFGVVGFLDAGDTTAEAGEVSLGHLHYAAGVGFRYDPVIALRLDLAYRLNRTGPAEPSPGARFAFHLSVGQAF